MKISVVNGTASKTSANTNDTITITATDKTGDLYAFVEWKVVSGDITIKNPTASTTSFVAKNADVTVEATYTRMYKVVFADNGLGLPVIGYIKKIAYPPNYTIPGDVVTVTAVDRTSDGYKFYCWTSNGIDLDLEEMFKETASFTIPLEMDLWYYDNPIEFVPHWDEINYNVTISDGVANKTTAQVGDVVEVTANNLSAQGKVFKQWVTTDKEIVFANKTQSPTTFTMPPRNVIIGAEFEKYSVSITVRNGTATYDSSTSGSECKIIANNRTKEGLVFREWRVGSGDIILGDSTSSTTTFKIGIQNVIVEALYDNITYSITVAFGTPSVSNGIIGDVVELEAFDRSNEGKVFSKWVVERGGVGLGDATSATTTISFGAGDIVIRAEYEDIVRQVKVVDGVAKTLKGIKGDTITISANDRTPEGYKFDHWECEQGGVSFARATSNSTTFQIQLDDVVVVAHYDFIEYPITAKNATASQATAHIGEEVTLTADDKSDSNLKFDHWKINKGSIRIADTSTATFTMIPSIIEIEAVYVQKAKPIDQSNYTTLQGRRDHLYGIIDSKVNYSKVSFNAGDKNMREIVWNYTTPEDGSQGATMRDTRYHVVEASLTISKNQNDE